ncbi:MAG TPA: hypothetical protein ENO34_04310, partial [Sulfurihydrogenibium azorense]|nr:hypothetical protein [Sulfurihydrogenibium azorense]
MNNEKGFSLITVLVLSAVIFALGSATVFVNYYGNVMINADVKYKVAEKRADYGIMRAFQDILNQNINCGSSPNYGDGITVNTVQAGNSCLIKSTGTYAGATVSKVVVINQSKINSKYAAAVMCNLTNLNIEGNGSIESCNSDCRTPALINGVKDNENINEKIKDIANATCKENNKGLAALMDPYLTDDNFSCKQELLSIYFNGVSDRNQLLDRMTSLYGVAFDNGGTPIGLDTTNKKAITITNTTDPKQLNSADVYDVCNFGQNVDIGTVEVDPLRSDTLQASSSYNVSGLNIKVKPTFVWDSTNKYYNVYMKNADTEALLSTLKCKAIDLGQNTTLNLGNGFSGGGALAANQVNFTGNVNGSNLTLIAKNEVKIERNGIEVSNVNVFSKKYDISNAQNLTVKDSLIFGGGGGQNIDIKLNSDSKLGTKDNPVLIISDNNINISRNGNAEINGI